jgi:hypothetical protein
MWADSCGSGYGRVNTVMNFGSRRRLGETISFIRRVAVLVGAGGRDPEKATGLCFAGGDTMPAEKRVGKTN